VLALHGGRDGAASASGAAALASAIKSMNNEITFILYEDLDHGFKDSAGQSMDTKVIADIRVWLGE